MLIESVYPDVNVSIVSHINILNLNFLWGIKSPYKFSIVFLVFLFIIIKAITSIKIQKSIEYLEICLTKISPSTAPKAKQKIIK